MKMLHKKTLAGKWYKGGAKIWRALLNTKTVTVIPQVRSYFNFQTKKLTVSYRLSAKRIQSKEILVHFALLCTVMFAECLYKWLAQHLPAYLTRRKFLEYQVTMPELDWLHVLTVSMG